MANSESTASGGRRFNQILADWEWLILGLMLPFVVLSHPLAPYLLLALPVLWLNRRLAYGHFLPPTPVTLTAFLLLLLALLSLALSPDPAFSRDKVVGLVHGIGLFFAVAAVTGRSERHLWSGVAAFITIGVGIVGLSFFGARFYTKIPFIDPILDRLPERILLLPELAAEGFHPNQVAGVLLWILPLVMVLSAASLWHWRAWWRHRPRWQTMLTILFLGAATAMLSLGLLLTQSRTGLLSLAAALSITFALAVGHFKRWLFAAAIGALILSGIVAYLGPEQLYNDVLSATGVRTGGSEIAIETLEARVEIWTRAVYVIQDFPYTGMGMNVFRREVWHIYPPFLTRFLDEDFAHAHNQLLQTGVDLGLPGLITYLALLLGSAAMLRHVWRHSHDRGQRALALGLAAALIAFFIYGFIDAVALGSRPGFIYWVLFGLIGGLFHLYLPAHSTPKVDAPAASQS